MKRFVFITIVFSIFLGCLNPLYSKTLSPIQFGLLEAKTDLERYNILLECHKEAVKQQKGVSYKDIPSITVELPTRNFESIPLSHYTDFAGGEFKCVYHGTKNVTLFSMTQKGNNVKVSAEEVDNANFKSVPELSEGLCLLSIKDEMPWIAERIGYGYGHYRKDVMIVKGGKGTTRTVKPYDNEYSKVSATYIPVSSSEKVFKNLRFVRDESNTAIVGLISASMQYNLHISNISVFTPQENNLFGDGIFTITNSVKVTFDNVNVDGTYSRTDKYGYAFNLNNVCDFTAKRLTAFGRWGVFGTNNLNEVHLEDCDINRFDIHCYGRDVECKNCRFSQLYNQFSSVFGRVEFYDCEFTDFIPVLMESSYNAYTQFDIIFQGCSFNMSKKKNYLITLLGLEEEMNSRPELARKALPNVIIKDCEVTLPVDVMQWYVINTGKVKYKKTIDYISSIDITNLLVSSLDNFAFDFFSTPIKGTKQLKLTSKRMSIKSSGSTKKRYKMQSSNMSNNAIVVINGRKFE